MTQSFFQFVLAVSGTIIMILLAAVAYFLKKWAEATDSLTQSVNDLKTSVELLKLNQGNFDKTCFNKHLTIDNRLNAHSEKLEEHSQAIAELKAKAPSSSPRRGRISRAEQD